MGTPVTPDPTPVLIAHSNNLTDLYGRLADLETRAGRIPAAVVAIFSASLSQLADELDLSDEARARLQDALEEAGGNASEMLNL